MERSLHLFIINARPSCLVVPRNTSSELVEAGAETSTLGLLEANEM